jgi:hypothetical protein
MFVRLTRPARAKAGWFIALLYLFCVIAPGVALALGDAASCLVHQFGTATAAHVHEGTQPQPAASHQHHAMQTDQPAMDHADAGHAKPGHAKHQHDGKGCIGPCCAMMCISAIAADLPAVARPVQPISLCVSEDFQRLPGEAPPLLYRPPIG